MAVATISDLAAQLNFTADMEGGETELLARKLLAAQSLIERQLGYRIEDRFGGEDQDPVPPDLVEAVLQLAAWWYENRETAGEGAREMPWGVSQIVSDYRDWSF